ncbi:hypothetical protein T261_3062 [Streptomyces lydicus]|nr:hypothetical protein T261_3062 [Streptomyces lydicus]
MGQAVRHGSILSQWGGRRRRRRELSRSCPEVVHRTVFHRAAGIRVDAEHCAYGDDHRAVAVIVRNDWNCRNY